MPALFHIIDGYNLLHAAGMAQEDYAQGELQRCRNRLIRFLHERMSRAEIARAVLVFDARDPPVGFPSDFKVGGLRVLFANPGGDADVLIETLIAEHSAPRQLRLISSDRRLQHAAKKRRATFRDSENFFEVLSQQSVASPRNRSERGATETTDGDHDDKRLSAAETSHWLQVFGEIPGVSELAEPSLPDDVPSTPPVKSPPPPPAAKPRKPGAPAGDDVDYWLKEFGEIPDAADLNRKPGIRQSDVDQWIAEFEKDDD